jgi:hypothetical protein
MQTGQRPAQNGVSLCFSRIVWGLQPVPSGKKCAHKTKLRGESIAGRYYIKFSEWLIAVQ